MAFLSNKNNNDNNLLSGAGGIAGEGMSVGGTPRTAAGTSGGWYNIQDFLQANQQTPNVQTRIEQKAGQGLSEAKNQLQSQQSGLSQLPTTEAYSNDRLQSLRQGGIDPNETSQIRGFLDQSLGNKEAGTQSYERSSQEQLPDIKNPYSNLQSGNFDSIMNWYGGLEKPSADYTPGMQKMDEMLLRGSKDFSTDFPSKMKDQYQQEVVDPLQSQRAELDRRKSEASQNFSDEGKEWHQGISGFLGGEKAKVNERLAQQQLDLAEQNQMKTQDIMGDYYNDLNFYNDMTGVNQLTQGGNTVLKDSFDPRYQGLSTFNTDDYITRDAIVDPTIGTAASSYFSNPNDLQSYNALAGLIGEEGYNTEGLADFNPGKWNFDNQLFEQDYRQKLGQIEEDKLRKQIDSLMNSYYDYGGTPETFRVPEIVDTKYGPMRLNLAEAGQVVSQRQRPKPIPTDDSIDTLSSGA